MIENDSQGNQSGVFSICLRMAMKMFVKLTVLEMLLSCLVLLEIFNLCTKTM